MTIIRNPLNESASSFFQVLSSFAHKAQMTGHYDRGWSPVLLQFRKSERFDWVKPYYAIDSSDGWFRIDHATATRMGMAYGLMIRSFVVTTPMSGLKTSVNGLKFNANMPGGHEPVIDLKGSVTYLPASEYEDDKAKYEAAPLSIWIDTGFVLQAYAGDTVACLRDLSAYIETHKHTWMP